MPTAAELIDSLAATEWPPEAPPQNERPLGYAEYVPRVVLGDPAAVPGLVEPGRVDINMRPADEDYVTAMDEDSGKALLLSTENEDLEFGTFKDEKSAEDYGQRLKEWNQAGQPGGYWKPTDIRPKDMPPGQFAEQVDLIEPGNIDLDKRIPVKTRAGIVDTEDPIAYTKTDKKDPNYGKTFLIPKIIDGKPLTESYAKRRFETTGEHLGVFKNELAAKEYSKKLRERQEQVYGMEYEVPTQMASDNAAQPLGLAPTSGKTAAELIDAEEPKPTGPKPTPVTQYSLGKSVGGPDKNEDIWTNRGYSAGGRQNLTEGVVAVNPKKYPLGTVFRDHDSGKVFIASDTHDQDPNIVDVYADPKNYREQSQVRNFQVIDQIPEEDIPHTAEGIRKLTAEYNRGTGTKEPLIPGKPEPPVKITIDNGIDPNAPYMRRPRDVRDVKKIVLHGDVNESAQELLEYGRHVDKQRGFDAGYHFYVARDGRVIQGAPVDRITNHTLGENKDSIGINVAGADEGKMPTPAQERATKELVAQLGEQYGIDPQNVVGHGELQPNRRNKLEGGYIASDIRRDGYRGKPKMRDWGIITPGNIDTTNRPVIQNPDGTVSTLRSISIDEDGKQVLIPTAVNGEIVSNDEAVRHYRSTGQHLGKFKTIEQADAYAQRLHEEGATKLELDARHERLRIATERATGAIRTQLQDEGIIPVPRAELARTERATLAKPKMTAAELLDAAEGQAAPAGAQKASDLIDGAGVESKAQSWWLNAVNSVGRGATSEGALMTAEGAYAMQEAGAKVSGTERLFTDSAEKRKQFARMRDAAREYLHVDDEFAQSLTGQIFQGIGQLALLPLYAIPGVGEATSAAQLFQEARDDYKETMKGKGTEEEADSAAFKYMVGAILPEAILNRFVLYRAFKPLIKAKKTVGQTAKAVSKMAAAGKAAGKVAIAATEGGVTEAGQQLYLNYIAKHLEGYDPDRKMDKEVVASLIVGGFVTGTAVTAGKVTQKLIGEEKTAKPTAQQRQEDLEKRRAEEPGKLEEPVTLGATEQAAESTVRKAELAATAAESTAAAEEQAAPTKEPFLEPETAQLKSGNPAVTVQETRERSQYEPGSRESVEYSADKVGKKFPGLPRIEVADTFEQIRNRFPEGAADHLSEEPVIFDRDLNRIIVIRDNMQDVPPEALQDYIARLALSQAAPVGGVANMLKGKPEGEVYNQALLRAFPELSVVDFGSAFGDTFGYHNLGELMEARELEPDKPGDVAKAIEEHASNVASMAGEKPRWFKQFVSDVQAIMGTMGMDLSQESATSLIEKSQPANEEHAADAKPRMDADKAAHENPYVVSDMSGRDLYPDVRLAGLDDIKIVEMPELLKLFRNITGGLAPIIKKMRTKLGEAGYDEHGNRWIYLHPDIFQDHVVAAKVAAHEIGHILDLFATGKFSGLKGIATKFPKMKETMREQVIELSKWWKPWDEGTAPPGYTKYRKKDSELFADAFSVLVNSPAELKKRAPMFYHAFFDYLQGHKNVGDAYFDMMAELHKPHMDLLRTRNKDLRQGMTDSAELWMAAKNKQKTYMEQVGGLIQDFKDQYYWKAASYEGLQRKLEKAGITVDPALDLRTMFDEHPLADNSVYTMFVRLQREVLEPLYAIGLTQQDLGVFLMHNRIMAGAYFDKAAPKGFNPKTSREQLALMRREIGLDRWQALEHHAEYFHNEVFEIAKEMYMSGLISKEEFTNVIIPNQHTYANFRPITHVEDHMTAGLQTVTGFMDDMENPFFSTVLKMVAMRRAIQWNRTKGTSIRFLETYYRELKEPLRSPGKGIDPKPNDSKENGVIKVKEDGVWKYYEVPIRFANQFNHPAHPSQVEAGARFLHFIFRGGFYQTFVRFNPYFQFLSSPKRDLQRLYTNMPAGVSQKDVADAYLKAIPAAKRRLKGEIDPIVMEMYETFAMSTPHDTFSRNFAKDDPLEMMMQEFHILRPADKAKWRQNKLAEWIEGLGDKIIFGGQVLEAAPKIAAYEILTEKLGWSRKRSAAYVRNKIGVPNYMKKGSHALSIGGLMPFWTVGLQGMNEDFKLLRGIDDMPVLNAADARAAEQGPDRSKVLKGILRRSATWWLRWAVASGMYALFQALAKEGILGDDLEELFSGVGDYQHTNKMIIPLGKVEGGEFGYKSAFAAIPQDEMSKVLGALLKKVVHMRAERWKDEPHDPLLNEIAGLFSTVYQAIPGAHPLIKIGKMWGQYAMRLNPYDEFRGRHILTEDQFLAGGWESIKPMMMMMVNESGITNLFKFNIAPDSTTEALVTNVPIFNNVLMVSDQGLREKQSNDISDPKADAARLRLQNLPTETAALLHEYNGIRRLGKHRTPYQETRFKTLRRWHKNIYKPTFERAAHYHDLGGDITPMMRAMEDQAERWKD